MIVYCDASVLLRIVLGQRNALKEWREIEQGVVSRLAEVECLRTLDRLRLSAQVSEEAIASRREATFRLLARLSIVEIGRNILDRAAQPFPTSLGTLDAIHLASALLYRERSSEDIALATHDHALGLAARASGLAVIGL